MTNRDNLQKLKNLKPRISNIWQRVNFDETSIFINIKTK